MMRQISSHLFRFNICEYASILTLCRLTTVHSQFACTWDMRSFANNAYARSFDMWIYRVVKTNTEHARVFCAFVSCSCVDCRTDRPEVCWSTHFLLTHFRFVCVCIGDSIRLNTSRPISRSLSPSCSIFVCIIFIYMKTICSGSWNRYHRLCFIELSHSRCRST